MDNDSFTFINYRSQLDGWIKALPLANPQKAAQMLYEELAKLFSLNIPTYQKIELLFQFYEPFSQINFMLKNKLLSNSPLAAVKQKELVYWVTQLPFRLATVYVSLVQKKQNEPHSEELNITIIFWAMYYLVQVLLINFIIYMPLPEKLWRDLHSLYFLGEKYSLLENNITNPTSFATISQIYKTGILIATASPYQLRRKDIEKLYLIITKWAPKLEINKEADSATFIIQLNKDEAPIYKEMANTADANEYTRFIHSKNFIDAITPMINQRSDDTLTKDTALSKNILENISRLWHSYSPRNYRREEKNQQIMVCLGIGALHYYLSSVEKAREEIALLSSDKNKKDSDTIDENEMDHWNKNYLLTPPKKEKPQYIVYKIFSVMLQNQSPGGIGVIANVDDAEFLQAFDIIGIYSTTDVNVLQIGNIRWIKHGHDKKVSVGVKILSPNAKPITVSFSESDDKRRYPGLLLAPNPLEKLPSTVILPSANFYHHSHLKIFYKNKEKEIVLVNPLILNNHFYQFTYQTLETSLKNPHFDFENPKESEVIDNIWDEF